MTGEEIKKLRESLGQTQEQFAKTVGVTFTTIFRWEKGISKPHPICMEKLKKIAKENHVVLVT